MKQITAQNMAIGCLAVLLVGAYFYITQEGEIDTVTPSQNNVSNVPTTATMKDTFECLPHKESGGAQTPECAFGMKAENGNHYALDLQSLGQEGMSTPTGAQIEITGLLVPIEQISTDIWQKYDLKGIIKVETLKKL